MQNASSRYISNLIMQMRTVINAGNTIVRVFIPRRAMNAINRYSKFKNFDDFELFYKLVRSVTDLPENGVCIHYRDANGDLKSCSQTLIVPEETAKWMAPKKDYNVLLVDRLIKEVKDLISLGHEILSIELSSHNIGAILGKEAPIQEVESLVDFDIFLTTTRELNSYCINYRNKDSGKLVMIESITDREEQNG